MIILDNPYPKRPIIVEYLPEQSHIAVQRGTKRLVGVYFGGSLSISQGSVCIPHSSHSCHNCFDQIIPRLWFSYSP